MYVIATLSVYPHRASLKNMPGHGGIRTYDLWNASPMLCQLATVGFEPTTFGMLAQINIILLDYIGIEGTRLSSEISCTRTDLTA